MESELKYSSVEYFVSRKKLHMIKLLNFWHQLLHHLVSAVEKHLHPGFSSLVL